ncbi:hypothetical protein CCACVL1_11262, partial [Corchorus capsularis]
MAAVLIPKSLDSTTSTEIHPLPLPITKARRENKEKSVFSERHNTLTEKYSDQNVNDSEDSGSEMGISLEKSLSDALGSFDNLFCRLCL